MADFLEQLRHRLYVFLSVDVVNSTPFKQGHEAAAATAATDADSPAGSRWIRAFHVFYSRMPAEIQRAWKDGQPLPRFWKSQGDELLYVLEITAAQDLVGCMLSWRSAVNAMRAELKQFPPLNLKSTAWLANFPIPNVEFLPHPVSASATDSAELARENLIAVLEHYASQQQHGAASLVEPTRLDFVGPSMDNGFRLTAHASATKMIVSLGLAWLLAESTAADAKTWDELDLYYDGSFPLKGIREGSPYPIFWMNTSTGQRAKLKAENRIAGKPPLTQGDLIEFCRASAEEDPQHFFKPYFDATVGEDHARQMRALRDELVRAAR